MPSVVARPPVRPSTLPPMTSTAPTRTLRQNDSGADVKSLQTALINKGLLSGNADGKFGPATRAAVATFQERNGLRADGVAGPATFGKLFGGSSVTPGPAPVPSTNNINSLNNSRVDTELPSRGTGFVTYNREGNDQFGTARTIARVKALGEAWNARHPEAPISVGDISRRGGGAFAPHATHTNGRNVDLRPFTKSGPTHALTYHDSDYSRALTKEFIQLAQRMVPGTRFLFNDPSIINAGLSSHSGGHDNHLHMMFP